MTPTDIECPRCKVKAGEKRVNRMPARSNFLNNTDWTPERVAPLDCHHLSDGRIAQLGTSLRGKDSTTWH